MKIIIDEMTSMADQLDKTEVDQFVGSLGSLLSFHPAIVGLAAGRMGYALRAFIMRLGHMGFHATMIGDTSVPRISDRDVVFVNSSSGETPSILLYAQQAVDAGAYVYTTTCNPDSSIGKLSRKIITLPTIKSSQLMKSPYEQFSMLLYDHLVMELFNELQLNAAWTSHNHSILE